MKYSKFVKILEETGLEKTTETPKEETKYGVKVAQAQIVEEEAPKETQKESQKNCVDITEDLIILLKNARLGNDEILKRISKLKGQQTAITTNNPKAIQSDQKEEPNKAIQTTSNLPQNT